MLEQKGIKFGQLLPLPAYDNVDQYLQLSRVYEESGFDSIWAADHTLLAPVGGFTPEVWALLNAVGQKTSSVRLGTAVTCLNRYHPAILAQRLATIDHLCDGRVTLGIGAGEVMNLKPYGIKRGPKPVTKMTEGIEVLQGLWKTRKEEEHFDYSGEFYELENAFLQINPQQESSIPIYLGANGPRTRHITGGLADGWLPFSESPDLLEKHLRDVKEGMREKPSKDQIEVAPFIYTAVDEDGEKAVETAKNYGLEIANPAKVRESKYDVDIPEEHEAGEIFNRVMVTKKYEEKRKEYNKVLTDEIIRAFAIVGSPEEVIEKIKEFIEAGVDHLILVNAGPDPRFVTDFYAKEVIPAYQ